MSVGRVAAVSVLALVLASACGREGTRVPVSTPAPIAQPSAAPSNDAASLGPIRPVLDDPRFAAVRERRKAKDLAGAASAFDAAAGLAPDTCELAYVSARLHFDGGDADGAARAFDRVDAACPLAAYALYGGARAYEKMGRGEDAMARARRVPEGSLVQDDARLVDAESRASSGDRIGAVTMWRAHLAAHPHGARWVDVSVQLASALLDGVDGDPSGHAQEAMEIATKVVVDVPSLADSSGAQVARDRAAAIVAKAGGSTALTEVERARRAEAWLEAGETKKALEEATAIAAIDKLPAPATEAVCRAALVRAQAITKTHGDAPAAYGDAIARCEGGDSLPSALFRGAKASAAAKRYDEAIARYGRIESMFPSHRLADDARFHAALVTERAGNAAKAETTLLALASDYPDGDMGGEALARVAIARLARGEIAAARETFEAAAARAEKASRSQDAARAAYWLARIAQIEKRADEARAAYTNVVTRWPFSFYMLMAYARLAEADPIAARKTMTDAIAREAEGELAPRALVARSADLARARALLEVGEIDLARRELSAIVGTDADVDSVWTLARMYVEAGAPDAATTLARTRFGECFAHYPSGRWRVCWEAAYPRAFPELVAAASTASTIPQALTWGIMREESGFVPEAKSGSDAFGLMQLIVPTARGVARGTGLAVDEASLKTPEVSIALGTKQLGILRASYPANRALAIAAYNAGGGSVGKWIAARPREDFDLWVEEIPFDETRAYEKRVLSSEAAYAYLRAPGAMDEMLSIPMKVSP